MATPIAHKGVTAGAKVQAMTMIDLLTKPALVEAGLGLFPQRADEGHQVRAADPAAGQAGHRPEQGDDGQVPPGDAEVLLRPVEVQDVSGAAGDPVPDGQEVIAIRFQGTVVSFRRLVRPKSAADERLPSEGGSHKVIFCLRPIAVMPLVRPARGMRDFLPQDVRRREYVIGIIEDVYRRYGFQPLETPALENIETLTGKYGEEGNKLIFKVLRRGEHEASGETDLALRYDLTVPLARVVASIAGSCRSSSSGIRFSRSGGRTGRRAAGSASSTSVTWMPSDRGR